MCDYWKQSLEVGRYGDAKLSCIRQEYISITPLVRYWLCIPEGHCKVIGHWMTEPVPYCTISFEISMEYENNIVMALNVEEVLCQWLLCYFCKSSSEQNRKIQGEIPGVEMRHWSKILHNIAAIYAKVGKFHVYPRFQSINTGWNLGLTRKFPSAVYAIFISHPSDAIQSTVSP